MHHVGKRWTLAGLAAFVAASSIPSAFLLVPDLPRDWLVRGPFTDYTVPAVALGVLVGGTALVAIPAAFLRPNLAAWASIAAGSTIIGFELVEIWAVGLVIVTHGPSFMPAWLQLVYLAVGAAQLMLAYRLLRADGKEATALRHAH